AMRIRRAGYGLYALKVGLLAATYIAVARIGLKLDPVSGFATFVWPPTGLSLAVLVLFGRSLWPGIALGAAVVNVWSGAPIAVASLYVGGLMPGARFGETWLVWWQGDAIGDLVVAPFLLSWASGLRIRTTRLRVGEAVALAAALLVASAVLLDGNPAVQSGLSAFRQPTTLLPLLIWAAVRFGTTGATGATLLVSSVAVWTTVAGR